MGAVAAALEPLADDERARVLRWARSRYSAASQEQDDDEQDDDAPDQVAHGGTGKPGATGVQEFSEFADLYDAANPRSQEDRALLAAYWLQVAEGSNAGVQSQSVNSLLKDMGHGIANVTSALSGLMAERPNSVMQTRKSGSTRQARKTYKVTLAGINRVKQMLAGDAE